MYYEDKLIENKKIENEVLQDKEFIDCEFKKCVFESCELNRCIFKNCKFTGCNIISLRVKDSQISLAEFSDCNLIGIPWYELISPKQILEPISKLRDSYLKYNTFIKMDFVRFDFIGNTIQESVFDECNLRESSFKGCRLEGTQYTGCNLQKADFRDTSGYQIDIMTNKLTGARFSFPDAINLLNGLGIKID